MVFLELRREAKGSSRVVTGTSWTRSCCLRKVRSLFELRGQHRDSSRVAAANRALSRVQSGNSVFLSGGNRDLGLPIKVQLGSQASSGVEPWNSAFLSSCQRRVRPPVEFRQGFGLFQEDRQGRQASHPFVRGYSVSHWSRCRAIRTYLELRGNSASFFLAAESARFHWRFNS